MLIYNEIGGALDNKLVYLRASSSTVTKSDKRSPHKFLKIYEEETTRRTLVYSFNHSREPFDIENIIEAMNREGIADLWIHEMKLRLKHSLGVFDFVFKNAPLTEGSEAMKWVQNYMKGLIRSGWLTRVKLRHLPLTGTESIPPGQNLALEEITSPEFIKWFSTQTGGLIRMKLIHMKDDKRYVDYAIKEVD